jgi:hypothetical protein
VVCLELWLLQAAAAWDAPDPVVGHCIMLATGLQVLVASQAIKQYTRHLWVAHHLLLCSLVPYTTCANTLIGCYIEHRPFEEPTQGSLATLRTTAISQLSNHNW